MSRFWHDRRGSVLPLYALTGAVVAALLSALLLNGVYFVEDRRVQSLADTIALLGIRDHAYDEAFALGIIADQGLDASQYRVDMQTGHYTPALEVAPSDRFRSGGRPVNALHVTVYRRTGEDGTDSGASELVGTATAARIDQVSFAIGSRLLRVEGGLSGAALDALGLSSRLTVADYRQLAAAHVDTGLFLNALADTLRVDVVTYQDILDARVGPQQMGQALQLAHQRLGLSLPNAVSRLGTNRKDLRVSDLLDVGMLAVQPRSDLPSGVSVSVLDMLESSLLLATGDRQMAFALDGSGMEVTLTAGEGLQGVSATSHAIEGAIVSTSQIRLTAQSQALPVPLSLTLDAAIAEAELTALRCHGNGAVRAEFLVRTSPAQLMMGEGRGLLGESVTTVDLGSQTRERVTLTHRNIHSGQPVIVGNPIDLSASGAGGRTLSNNALSASLGAVSNFVDAMGLHLGEAELYLRDAQCGRPFLVR